MSQSFVVLGTESDVGMAPHNATKQPMVDKQLYSGVELCRTLEAGVRCFRIRIYEQASVLSRK